MKIHLFEDDRVERLDPITTSRPAYAISCGGMRLIDVAAAGGHEISATVREQFAAIQALDYPDVRSSPTAPVDWLLNARIAPRFDLLDALGAADTQSVAWMHDDRLIAARLANHSPLPKSFEPTDLATWISAHSVEQRSASEIEVFDYPHDVIRLHESIFASNLAARIKKGDLTQIADGVFAADGFEPPTAWSIDAREGPVVLECGCRVGPFTALQGPVLVGANAIVNPHTALKHNVALGSTTKVGGELEASIIEPFSNKQHYGFLGHAYVGSWVNLGAGTCNSDLKNTYGTVRVSYGGVKIDTGMQFMGCVLGDYVKTAINATIFTGKRIGVGSMVYGYVTQDVPAFVNYAAQLGQVTQVSPDVIVTMQRRMFGRRGREQQPCHVDLIRKMFAATAKSREGMDIGPPAF